MAISPRSADLPKKTSHPPPKAGRPYMPGYQMMFRKGVDALSWAWAVKRLSGARQSWLGRLRGFVLPGTTKEDLRICRERRLEPHTMVVHYRIVPWREHQTTSPGFVKKPSC